MRTFAVHAISTIAKQTSPIHGVSHIWNAGRIEMNATEMPASVPSIAARGVSARICGPTNAPISTMTPMMKHHASPACHARIGSFVVRYVGSMIRNTTMNMCGTLGPYGIAVTSVRPSAFASCHARYA
jgi:hypothetical protein